MGDDYRRHHAPRDREIVFVAVPVPVGGPQHIQRPPPGPYPKQRRDPVRLSKGQKVQNLVQGIARQEHDLRQWMDSLRRTSAERRRAEQVSP